MNTLKAIKEKELEIEKNIALEKGRFIEEETRVKIVLAKREKAVLSRLSAEKAEALRKMKKDADEVYEKRLSESIKKIEDFSEKLESREEEMAQFARKHFFALLAKS